jgi:hypothetical protein
MATTKKTVKKQPAKKAPSRSNAKTTVRRVSATKSSKATQMKSFVPSPANEPFFTFRVSQQTLYWLVLAVVVIGLGVWVMNINEKVQKIYDQIDTTNSMINSMPEPAPAKTAQ